MADAAKLCDLADIPIECEDELEQDIATCEAWLRPTCRDFPDEGCEEHGEVLCESCEARAALARVCKAAREGGRD